MLQDRALVKLLDSHTSLANEEAVELRGHRKQLLLLSIHQRSAHELEVELEVELAI